MSWLLLAFGLLNLCAIANALAPRRRPWFLVLTSFFWSWMVTELPLHLLASQLLAASALVLLGAHEGWTGGLGLAACGGSSLGLLWLARQASASPEVLERALREGLGEGYRAGIEPGLAACEDPSFPWRSLLLPFSGTPASVRRVRDIVYARASGIQLKLDVYQGREAGERRPVLLEIHGGAWVLGRKDDQGLPLMRHLAARGWVCVSANYRLSPRATFPDPLVDIKRAIAWIRQHIADYGGDPDFLVVSGGSAGGHLASLVALSANDPEYQPGFEEIDTRVRACVPFYGVYDFTNRYGYHDAGLARLLEQLVMKASLSEARERYERASPMSLVGPEAPPFFVVHGALDVLAPVEEARRFVELLRERSRAQVAYAELPGAQHAFEVFHSFRSIASSCAVERFLAAVYSEHLRAERLGALPRALGA